MFYRICGDEYREGFYKCAQCEVNLVPQMTKNEEIHEGQIKNMGLLQCELIKDDQLYGIDLSKKMDSLENIYKREQLDISLKKCKQCSQLFVHVLVQIDIKHGSYDYWNFWIPIDISEREILLEKPLDYAQQLIKTKGHLCLNPQGQLHWSDSTPEADILFESCV